MNKKLWKRAIAFVMVCVIITSIAVSNTVFAANNGEKTIASLQQKVIGRTAAESGIARNLQLQANSLELNRILEECEEVKTDDALGKMKKGQMLSMQSAHGHTSMAIMPNGDLYCWGDNEYGEVGNGTTKKQSTPVRVLNDVISVSCSSWSNHFFISAITENGDLYCWGDNEYGQIGNGSNTEKQLTPVKVLSDVISVSSDVSSVNYSSITAAITKNGDLYCWGSNQYGQTGNGTTEKQLTPVKVLHDVKSVSSCHGSVSAVTKNGDLYCWGNNGAGQVGNGTFGNQLTPVKVLSDVKSVSFFNSPDQGLSLITTVSAITENGNLYCWGNNAFGQVGNGTFGNQATPVRVLSDVISVSYSSSDSATVSAITENGDLYCWGYNGCGAVGNGSSTKEQATPVKVLSDVISVSYYNCASYFGNVYSFVLSITENGDLYCWGYNRFGQLGNGTIKDQFTPVKVLSDVKTASASSSAVSAIMRNGDLYRWGYNNCGQVGNGTGEDQLTPVKVLSDVKAVSYSYYSVLAIIENGDLYCWGYNSSGQVGNGTTENQLTPVKVLSDVQSVSYAYFSVSVITENGDLYCWGENYSLTPTLILGSSLSSGLHKDGCLQIPDAITIEKGKDKYITGKVFADNLDKLKEISNSLVWSSENPSVATVECRECLIPVKENAKETIIVAKVTGISRGETDILVSAPDGSKACCHVVASKPAETVEEPSEIEYSYCFSIAGELQEVDSANETIKIDGINYEAFSNSSLTDAKNILEQHDNKIVACRVRAADNKIERIDNVKDIIGKPSVRIKPEVDNINYENGKISKKNFKIDLEMYCAIKKPYILSDIADVIKNVDGVEVTFSKVSLETMYNNTGEIPFLLKDGLFGSQESSFEKVLNFKLKPWQTKKISITAYVKDGLLIKNVNADAVIMAKVNDDKKTETTETVHLSNLDKSREEEQKKLATSLKSTELKKASNILNGIQVEYTELDLNKCLTSTEVKAISAQVYNWIYTLNALNVIINDDNDSSALKKLLKKCGLTKEDIQNKVLKKMGIDKNVIPWMDSYTGTLQFEAKDKNTGKKITIKFTADMSLYTLGGSAFGGFGTLKYKISSGGSGQGPITYTNMDNFVASLKKVVDSQIHNCYNKIYADGINEIFNDSVADSLVSSTFGKLVNEKYGSASEAVYTALKYGFTGYTEEDAKKSIKDVVIILTKDVISRYTYQSIDCPVNVTVYDGDGNICAEIKDDVVNEKYQDVAAYVKGEAKYLLLPDADYTLCYSGSDIGTMDYSVTEYENGEAVRELIYNDVPLTTEKKYVNYLISGRHQGISLYNLNQVEGGVVEATSDIDKTKEQDISAKSITLNDKTLSLKKEESYILMETISPDDVSIRDLTWSSSNDDVVEVNGSGVLYAKADGEAVITVKINGRNLSDSCRVTVGEGNASSSAPDSTSTPVVTRQPGGIVPQPPVGPTDTIRPSYTNTPMPTAKPTGTVNPSYTNTPVPTAKPTSTTRPSYTNAPSPTGTLTPKPTNEPIETPSSALKPSDTPKPTTTPSPENNSNSAKKLKKGSKVTDKKTKAVYKITGTGKSRTVEYIKSTKKNPNNISVPASVKLKGKTYKVTSVGKAAFKNSKKLKTVRLGKNVKKIDQWAFSGCMKLTDVTLGKKVTTIGANAFNKCTALIIITIPSKVTKIGTKAFYQCKNLRYILVRTNKLTVKNVGSNAFGKGAAKLRVKTDKTKWKLYAQIFMSKGMSKKALFI